MRNQLNGKWLNKNLVNSSLEIKGGVLFELISDGKSLLDKHKSKNLLEEMADIQTFWDIDNSIGIKLININLIQVYKYDEPLVIESAKLIGNFTRQ